MHSTMLSGCVNFWPNKILLASQVLHNAAFKWTPLAGLHLA
jgi:hypothetical protein